MSSLAIAWAMRVKNISPGERVVLIWLGEHCDAEHFSFPGQKLLSQETGIPERSVRGHLAGLQVKGHIRREHRYRSDGTRTSDAYWLNLPEGFNYRQKKVGLPANPAGSLPANPAGYIYESSQIGSEPQREDDLPPSQNPQPDSAPAVEWIDALWLKQFLSEQQVFNGNHLPRLDYNFWTDLSEAVNGLDLVTVQREFAKMSIWLRDNPTRRPTVKGVRRFVAGWFERAYERERRLPSGQAIHGQR